jgi:proton-dependent oligopeptide transporter, POT family
VSFMMAVWFLASSIGQFVGGRIAGLMGTETVGGQVLDPAAAFATSMDGFNKLGWAGVACGVVFVALSFAIKGWAHGADQPPAIEPPAAAVDAEAQTARS